MSVTSYTRLENDNDKLLQEKGLQKQSIGIELPTLFNDKGLNISAELTQSTDLNAMIAAFNPSQGWVLHRDKIELYIDNIQFTKSEKKTDIIEAEFTNGNDSLLIKHQYSNNYLVTRLTELEKDSSKPQVFNRQQMLIRNNLRGNAKYICYKIWFEQAQNEQNRGRWMPLIQQFVGFDIAGFDKKEVKEA